MLLRLGITGTVLIPFKWKDNDFASLERVLNIIFEIQHMCRPQGLGGWRKMLWGPYKRG